MYYMYYRYFVCIIGIIGIFVGIIGILRDFFIFLASKGQVSMCTPLQFIIAQMRNFSMIKNLRTFLKGCSRKMNSVCGGGGGGGGIFF